MYFLTAADIYTTRHMISPTSMASRVQNAVTDQTTVQFTKTWIDAAGRQDGWTNSRLGFIDVIRELIEIELKE